MFKFLKKIVTPRNKGEEPSSDDISKPSKEDETTSLLSSSTKLQSSSTMTMASSTCTMEATEQLYRQQHQLQQMSSEHTTSSIEDAEFGAQGFIALTFPSPKQSEKVRLLDYNIQKKRILYYLLTKIGMCTTLIVLTFLALVVAPFAIGPPSQPVGAYKLVEAHAGHDFWEYYDFFDGRDSAGSHGHIVYVSEEKARQEGIVNVVTETVRPEDMIEIYEEDDPRAVENWLAEDLAFLKDSKRKESEYAEASLKSAEEAIAADEERKTENRKSSNSTTKGRVASTKKKKKTNRFLAEEGQALELDGGETELKPPKLEPFNPDPSSGETAKPEETFVYISSSPSPNGPRNSVRLEGRRRFNRGLFIIDLRHLPVSCGSWPAFWLTDEENWPENGEIDIIEGVNYQDSAKLALHTSKECHMDDVPEGLKTGGWDTAVGFIDNKTGKPDMTLRYAKSCFAYEQHQWLNQGCVAMDLKQEGKSLGKPLNDNGGGVYVMEWDPLHNYIKAWVFAPHNRVPSNLRNALRTASNTDESARVSPDTSQWGLPYAYFPIGDGTKCSSEHFLNMRLVINLAFCGSMAGERYFVDCPRHVSFLFPTIYIMFSLRIERCYLTHC